jgi:hypothetical protein
MANSSVAGAQVPGKRRACAGLVARGYEDAPGTIVHHRSLLGDRRYLSHVCLGLFVLPVLPRSAARAVSARGEIATGAVLYQARASDY